MCKKILSSIFLLLISNYIFAKQLDVVVSFSVLADIVKQIGGNQVNIISIVGRNQDSHGYELKPSDIISISKSQMLIINGLGLEDGWIHGVTKFYKGYLVVASNGISSVNKIEKATTKVLDPHIWNNPLDVIDYYIPNILASLIAKNPTYASYFINNANHYRNNLNELDYWIKKQLDTIPLKNRQAITTHDAFSYFAKQYGINFISVQGVSTDSEATAKDVARLEHVIRSSSVKVVFLENMANNQLIKQVANDSGAKIGGKLYSDALSSAKEPANTYINMVKCNVNTLVSAWK